MTAQAPAQEGLSQDRLSPWWRRSVVAVMVVVSGLCAEGRWEYAMQAISTLDLEKILRQASSPDG